MKKFLVSGNQCGPLIVSVVENLYNCDQLLKMSIFIYLKLSKQSEDKNSSTSKKMNYFKCEGKLIKTFS